MNSKSSRINPFFVPLTPHPCLLQNTKKLFYIDKAIFNKELLNISHLCSIMNILALIISVKVAEGGVFTLIDQSFSFLWAKKVYTEASIKQYRFTQNKKGNNDSFFSFIFSMFPSNETLWKLNSTAINIAYSL